MAGSTISCLSRGSLHGDLLHFRAWAAAEQLMGVHILTPFMEKGTMVLRKQACRGRGGERRPSSERDADSRDDAGSLLP